MEKIDAFKIVVEIERILNSTNIFVKKQLTLPPAIIEDLDKVGDMSRDIEAYAKMTNDVDFIRAIGKIPRAVLHQVSGWYNDIAPKTRESIAYCARSLHAVAMMDVTPIPTTSTTIPTALDTPRAQKYILKAVEAGLAEHTATGMKWKGKTQMLLAYFCQRVWCETDEGKDNRQPFPEKALNQFWGCSRLGKARTQYISNKNGGKPGNFETIDKLFG